MIDQRCGRIDNHPPHEWTHVDTYWCAGRVLVEGGAFPRRTCFRCVHYSTYDGGRCDLFEERIDSELFAARDCEGYEVES